MQKIVTAAVGAPIKTLNTVHKNMKKLSGYATTRNCESLDYPYVESITSMLQFCDEVCVLDTSDKDDGTRERLQELVKTFNGKLVVKHVGLDWAAPNAGVYDGQTKQMAREMCTGDMLWQQDVDEVLHESGYHLIRPLVEKLAPQLLVTPIISLPIVEFWGNKLNGKVRLDVNLWKWRLSVNHPSIQHGIPMSHRALDITTGLMFAKPGTDGCDYIHTQTGQPIPSITLIPGNIENLRQEAVTNPILIEPMTEWLNQHIRDYPTVFHYSWFDMERKIKAYREFWTGFWQSLYREEKKEEDNYFFPGRKWSSVTDEEIKQLAKTLETQTTGWIFHSPWNGTKRLGVPLNLSHPAIMTNWIAKRS